MRRSKLLFLVLLFCLAGLDLIAGGGHLGLPSAWVLWKIRLPRILTAALSGAALGLSGAQMQSLFRNPLADPHIMGISSGASLGAALLILAFPFSSLLGTAAAALIGAALAALLILTLAARLQGTLSLLIGGVMLGFAFSAITGLLQFFATEENLKLYYGWAAGSFQGNSYPQIGIMATGILLGILLALRNARGLDILLFGEEFARIAQAPVRRIRTESVLSVSLLTGTVTAFTGPLGFVGIAAPHIARRFFGATHAELIPGSLLFGALCTLLADLLASLWRIPLPAGSTLALIGIPMVLYIMLKNP